MDRAVYAQADEQARAASERHGSASAAYDAWQAAVGPFPPYLNATPLEREYPWALLRLIQAEAAAQPEAA